MIDRRECRRIATLAAPGRRALSFEASACQFRTLASWAIEIETLKLTPKGRVMRSRFAGLADPRRLRRPGSPITKEIERIVKAIATDLTDLLFRVEQHRRALLADALAHRALNLTQWIALCVLARDGACGMTELAQATAIDRTSLTRTIDILIQRGLVARHTPPRDRRTVMVQASPEGQVLATAIRLELEVLQNQWFAAFSDGEQDRLAEGLRKLLAGLAPPQGKPHLAGEAARGS
jgi:DNA-binding MarR family transcriptional regulator